jgi:glutaconyl-CoA decarboxylase
MNDFVTLCGRDRVPIIWFQDTRVSTWATLPKSWNFGLGQSLIYSIEQTNVPMMLFVLRKGTAAAHYIMGGPTANNHCTFTLGTPTTEIYVMHGETAATASFARRLVKEKDENRPLEPIIDRMNALAQQYYDQSRVYQAGFVDEVVPSPEMRARRHSWVRHQTDSLCPHHLMMIPRLAKDRSV